MSTSSDVSTKTIATRGRAKLQDANKNILVFKLPYENVKTLKTTKIVMRQIQLIHLENTKSKH